MPTASSARDRGRILEAAGAAFSRGDYLFMATAETTKARMPSDVGQIAGALFLPYWFWGAVCRAVSIAVLAYGLKVFWRK